MRQTVRRFSCRQTRPFFFQLIIRPFAHSHSVRALSPLFAYLAFRFFNYLTFLLLQPVRVPALLESLYFFVLANFYSLFFVASELIFSLL